MARLRLFHWKAQEAQPLIKVLRAAGHQVAYDEKIAAGLFSKIRAAPPDAFVISLARLPSHGREVAAFLRHSKSTRHIPIVFVGGEPEKVSDIRRRMPDAAYTALDRLVPVIKAALRNPPAAPVVPTPMMERYRERSAAQKLGITPGAAIGLLDPPRDYEAVLSSLPENVSFFEDGGRNCGVTLWFVTDPGVYQTRLYRMRALASKSRLWILWQKGRRRNGISPAYLRETAASAGLVDYKICSVNDRWSAMAFAPKKNLRSGTIASQLRSKRASGPRWFGEPNPVCI